MNASYPDLPAAKIVYVRQIEPEALPDAVRTQIDGDHTLWGVHAPDGTCIAVTRQRRDAFVLARQNDMTPVSAH